MSGLLAMLIAVAVCALIGGVQGSIVAFVGVPSFVVTLAGFLIWQGVILNKLQERGTIIIQDRWINYTDLYIFSPAAGWVIAAIFTALYPLSVLYRKIVARGTQIAQQSWTSAILKTIGIGIAAFGTVAICNNAKIISTPLGLPLPGVLMVLFFVLLTFLAKWTTFGRHVYAVGGSAEAARRAGINVPRVRVLVFALSGAMAAIGGIIFAAQVNSVALTFPPGNLLLNAIAAAVIGGVSLFGGRGEVRGALLGAILIGTLQNGLNTLSISNGWIYIVTGARAARSGDARHGRGPAAGALRPLAVATEPAQDERRDALAELRPAVTSDGTSIPPASGAVARRSHLVRVRATGERGQDLACRIGERASLGDAAGRRRRGDGR